MNGRIQKFKNKANVLIEYVLPRYSELTTYQAAITFILLLIFYPEIISGLHTGITIDLNNNPGSILFFIIIFLITVAGVGLSIWHVFICREKDVVEKWFMGAFAILVSGLAGLMATMELLPDKWSILLVFPIWNYLWGMLLLDRLTVPHEAITDEDATIIDVIVATIVLGLTFYIAHIILRYSWSLAFSMCMSISSFVLMIYKRIVVTIKNIA